MLTEGMYIADRYEIVGKVGSGGMSDVYKAKDHILGRFVAIKVLKQEFSEDRNFVAKFRTEAQSAAVLEHANIVNIYDVGSEDGLYYIVMEYVEGITLKTYVEKKGQLSFKESASIAIQVARGIEAAHNKNIIHRDIKPQNIIISTEGKVKVTDFGIAKAASSNTISSDVMGSVHYASPEQARNGFVDGRSDIYSLGIVMYEMITGRVPFDGDTTVAVAIQHLQEEMTKPSTYAPNTPISFEKIILKCTQKNPDRRYQSLAELLVDLRKSLHSPNEDFVVIAPLIDNGKTKVISEEDIKQIKDRGIAPSKEIDVPLPEVDNDDEDDDDDNNGGILNPKMNKAMNIFMIVMAVLIVCVMIYLLGSIFGLFKPGNNKSSEPTTQTETETETNTEELVKMIKVVGTLYDDAESRLQSMGLGIFITKYEESNEPDGTILSQDVAEGEDVAVGTTINVTVAGDPTGNPEGPQNPVPDVVGKDEATAVNMLQLAGFICKKEYEASSTIAAGTVIRQTPTGTAAKGSTVTIYISKGEDDVTVPNVVGKSESKAKAALQKLGLTVNVTTDYSDTVAEGLVISQNLKSGTKVKPGKTITIVVSLGAKVTLYKFSQTIQLGDAAYMEYTLVDANGNSLASGSSKKSSVTISASDITTSSGTLSVTWYDEEGNVIDSSTKSVQFSKQ